MIKNHDVWNGLSSATLLSPSYRNIDLSMPEMHSLAVYCCKKMRIGQTTNN